MSRRRMPRDARAWSADVAKLTVILPGRRRNGVEVGRRQRPFQDRPGRREGWARHPMQRVTCDIACRARGWQETSGPDARLAARLPTRPFQARTTLAGQLVLAPNASCDALLVTTPTAPQCRGTSTGHDTTLTCPWPPVLRAALPGSSMA